MAETSRNNTVPRNPQYPQGASYPNGEVARNQQLPSGDACGNPQRTRSAEAIGRQVGVAIFQVRRIPRRIDTAASRLREAGGHTRANASAKVLKMMDVAAGRAETLRHSTGQNLAKLRERASYRASELGHTAVERWQDFRRISEERLHEARRRTEAQWIEGRRSLGHWQRKDPVRFMVTVAGGAFLIGAAMRIWRSNHE